MKAVITLIAAGLLFCLSGKITTAQTPSPTASVSASPASSPTVAGEIYHVHFAKAAPGKTSQLADDLKKPDPEAPMPGHVLVLRHQQGEGWDYAAIQHLGSKVTLDAARPAPSPEERSLGDWHNDTYAIGPSWAEFAKEMGLDDAGKAKSAGSVYVVSTFRALPGQREALEKFLAAPDAAVVSAGSVLLQHLEGSSWNFVRIERFGSWEEFAKSESAGVADAAKSDSGWHKMRTLIAEHADTVAVRIAP